MPWNCAQGDTHRKSEGPSPCRLVPRKTHRSGVGCHVTDAHACRSVCRVSVCRVWGEKVELLSCLSLIELYEQRLRGARRVYGRQRSGNIGKIKTFISILRFQTDTVRKRLYGLFVSFCVALVPVFFVSARRLARCGLVSSVSVFADHLHSWLPSLRAQGYRLADALTHYNRSVKQAAS